MNALGAATAESLRAPWSGGRVAGRLGEIALGAAMGVAVAAAIGYAPVSQGTLMGLVFGIAGAVLLFASPLWAAVLLGASLPALQDLSGGGFGLHVAASDIVLVLFATRLLADAAASQRVPILRVLRPVRFPVLQYACLIGLLLVLHPGLVPAFKSLQRLELIALPLLIGAYVALRNDHMLVLRVYVLSTTVLAAVWPVLDSLGLQEQLQKNPTGQLIANAILLIVAVRGLRPLVLCLPVLVTGLALTASRGAIVTLILGIAVVAVMYRNHNLRVVIARSVLVVVAALAVYQWLPNEVRSHVTNYSAEANSVSSYPIYVREQYRHDAAQLVFSHAWTGVGVGNYRTGDVNLGTATEDPHNIVLLQAAEGGYIFALSFLVLIGGTVVVLWRLRHVYLAPAAAGVLIATVSHGLVDVYWVRGTPVLGWLLVGMVCGLAASRSERAV